MCSVAITSPWERSSGTGGASVRRSATCCRGLHVVGFALPLVEHGGLVAVGLDVGPPQLPHDEQAEEEAEGDEQFAEDADEPGNKAPPWLAAPPPRGPGAADPLPRVRRCHALPQLLSAWWAA